MKNKIFYISSLLLLTFLLQACFNAVTTGAQAVYNRHQWQKSMTDQYIVMKAYKLLYVDSKQFKDTNIVVSSYNYEVLLAGQVPAAWQKVKAEALVKTIPHVDEVYNLIKIQSPSSALTRVSDTWITTKVKSKLIASNDVDASQVKVVTENGVVYLMGVLPEEDAGAAVEIASNTDGVLSVVRLFSYMSVNKKPKHPTTV